MAVDQPGDKTARNVVPEQRSVRALRSALNSQEPPQFEERSVIAHQTMVQLRIDGCVFGSSEGEATGFDRYDHDVDTCVRVSGTANVGGTDRERSGRRLMLKRVVSDAAMVSHW